MKKLLVFLLPLVMMSCISRKQFVGGSYEYKNAYGIAYKMDLHQNGMFTYNWQIGLNKGTTSGSWNKDGSYLFLKSGPKSTEDPLIVHEGFEPKKDSISIEVLSFEGAPLGLATIVLNDEQTLVADLQGKATLSNSTLRKIEINYLNFKIPKYQVKNSSANTFIIKVFLELIPSLYFDNTRVKVKRKKIIILRNPFLDGSAVTLKRMH